MKSGDRLNNELVLISMWSFGKGVLECILKEISFFSENGIVLTKCYFYRLTGLLAHCNNCQKLRITLILILTNDALGKDIRTL